jgi:hypothetical protein
MSNRFDQDAAEILRHWRNGKDEWHGWKCALTTLAYQLDPEWTAEDCRDHILSIANQLGYGESSGSTSENDFDD